MDQEKNPQQSIPPEELLHMTDILRMVAEDLDVPVLDTFIRDSVALREAQSLQRSVLEYAPECNAVQDYKKLIQELIQRGLKADV